MKRIALLLTAVMLLCGLCGCVRQVGPPAMPTEPETTTHPIETTTQPTETGTQPTEVATEPLDALPYPQRIPLADQSIFEEPTYDSRFLGVVGQAGTYTIVEERTDEEGNLWGKLKSGAGWVDLTQIRATIENPPVLTVNYADKPLLDSGEYHYRPVEEGIYLKQVAFRAGGTLTDFCVATVSLADEGYVPDEVFYTLEQLTPEKPLVMDLPFPGDMSAYIISFRDSTDAHHQYLLTISGRNGTLVLGNLYP